MLQRFGIPIIVAIVILLQLLTLNAPWLNGDEAMYMLILEQIKNIAAGNLPALNPIIDYSGPLDFWLLGSVYALFSGSNIPAAAWMVRIVPLMLFWAGVILLWRDINKEDKNRAGWLLFLFAVLPMTAIYSRVAFPHGVMLAAMIFLLRESLRIARGSSPRLLLIALICGIAEEANPSSMIGAAAMFIPVLPRILKEAQKHKVRLIAAVLIFVALIYPVARNFPPPVGGDGALQGRYFLQLRSLANIISGFQPYTWWLGQDVAPAICQGIFALVVLLIFGFWLARRGKRDVILGYVCGFLGATVLIAWIMTRGRSLEILGHERYLLPVVPLGVYLLAEAITWFVARLPDRRQFIIASGLILLFFGSHFLRLQLPLLKMLPEPDSARTAAAWMSERCLPADCVLYMENFWDYWPARYYTRDKLRINFVRYNWKQVQYHAPEGRNRSACWFLESAPLCVGGADALVEFRGPAPDHGHVCALNCEQIDGVAPFN